MVLNWQRRRRRQAKASKKTRRQLVGGPAGGQRAGKGVSSWDDPVVPLVQLAPAVTVSLSSPAARNTLKISKKNSGKWSVHQILNCKQIQCLFYVKGKNNRKFPWGFKSHFTKLVRNHLGRSRKKAAATTKHIDSPSGLSCQKGLQGLCCYY